MRRLERADDLGESMLAVLPAHQSTMWTALPGIIQSFKPAEMTCVVSIPIRAWMQLPGAKQDWISMPPLVDCPVVFPSGGGFTLTFPLVAGDECLVVFSSRCIDSWWDLGGVQNPAEFRMHDLSDGFVLPGPHSKPRVVPSISMANVQLRNDAGTAFVEITPGANINVTSPGTITMTAPNVVINGHLTVNGNTDIVGSLAATTGGLTHNGVNVGAAHTHSGVRSGTDTSGVPT